MVTSASQTNSFNTHETWYETRHKTYRSSRKDLNYLYRTMADWLRWFSDVVRTRPKTKRCYSIVRSARPKRHDTIGRSSSSFNDSLVLVMIIDYHAFNAFNQFCFFPIYVVIYYSRYGRRRLIRWICLSFQHSCVLLFYSGIHLTLAFCFHNTALGSTHLKKFHWPPKGT